MVFRDEAIVAHFRAGPKFLSFGGREIGDKELHTLAFAMLPCALGMVDLPVDLVRCWDDLSAALYGYQIRIYMEEQVAMLTHISSQSRLAFSNLLHQRYESVLARWEALAGLVVRQGPGEADSTVLISTHNMRWAAQQVIFAYQDLQAFAQGDAAFVSTLNDRHRHLGDLYR